jgi:hypothetical protein
MKKLTVWALLAMLVIAGSAFAAPKGTIGNATFDSGNPTTTDNDDSCDIGVAPAATLLLPYFEVAQSGNETTLFTITNTSAEEQIAHVTLWTDYSFPVIDFNIYLTGYDVQAINLHDIIWRGVIAPDLGTGTDVSDVGEFSVDNPDLDLDNCDELPGSLPDVYVLRMQQAFTLGRVSAFGAAAACNTVGGTHTNAVGYATIDVARVCSINLPTSAAYFATEIMFDNVLVGDYQQVNSANNFAQGNPMVHIRAIPEGGLPTDVVDTNFDRTFYSRYQPLGGGLFGTADRRQPLPSVFAARWINGSASDFQTSYKIWREGVTTAGAVACAAWPNNVTSITESVIFDEEENPEGAAPSEVISPPLTTNFILPETSLTRVTDTSVFPRPTTGAVAGWVYLNLDNNASDGIASQNWVIVSMRAEGRYSVDFDAAWLANGCSAAFGSSEVTLANGIVIGPAVAEDPTNPVENYNP